MPFPLIRSVGGAGLVGTQGVPLYVHLSVHTLVACSLSMWYTLRMGDDKIPAKMQLWGSDAFSFWSQEISLLPYFDIWACSDVDELNLDNGVLVLLPLPGPRLLCLSSAQFTHVFWVTLVLSSYLSFIWVQHQTLSWNEPQEFFIHQDIFF